MGARFGHKPKFLTAEAWQPIHACPTNTLVQVYCPWVEAVAWAKLIPPGHRRLSPGWILRFTISGQALRLDPASSGPTHWQPVPRAPVQP